MLNARRQSGVTLIEALIVVALIVILLVLALPMVGEWLANGRIRTAAESLLVGLQLARAEAVRRNAPVEFVLGSGVGYTVRTQTGETIQSRSAAEATADVIVEATPGGATTVSFDGLGRRIANVDTSAPLERIDLDLPATVLSPEKTRDLRLVISSGGQITLCDPNVTATDDVRRCP